MWKSDKTLDFQEPVVVSLWKTMNINWLLKWTVDQQFYSSANLLKVFFCCWMVTIEHLIKVLLVSEKWKTTCKDHFKFPTLLIYRTQHQFFLLLFDSAHQDTSCSWKCSWNVCWLNIWHRRFCSTTCWSCFTELYITRPWPKFTQP